ncbi:sigma 54-interacting transcriptional regulator [Myxococcota bacterium]|nr:sigma 54-interacting transcriptional regulator [Myxococcota bacterium]
MAQDDGIGRYITRVLDEGPALNIADQRHVTIRAFSTCEPWDRPTLEARLKDAWLPEDRDIGVLSFLSNERSMDVRVVVGKQGDKRFRRYDYSKKSVESYEISNVITDNAAVRYQPDEDGNLRFITIGGGSQLTEKALNGFHHARLDIDEAGVQALAIRPERMRQRALSPDFLDRLYLIKFQTKHEGYRSIEHTEFKSREAFDAECERLKELQGDPELLVEAFESEVDVHTENIAKQITVGFEVRAASGSIKLKFPSIPWDRQLLSRVDQSFAFYDLVEATLEKVLGRDFFVRAGLVEGLTQVDGVFPEWASTAPFKDRMRSPALRRSVILETLDAAADNREWVPWAHAIEEQVTTAQVAEDVQRSLEELSRRDPHRLLALLRGCMDKTYLHLGALCFAALRKGLTELPGPLIWDGTRLSAAWLLARDSTAWSLDPDHEGVIGDGVRFELDELPTDGQAAVLRAALRAGCGEPRLDLAEAVAWGLRELRRVGLTDLERAALDEGLLSDRKAMMALLPSDGVPDDAEALETAVCRRLGLPLFPHLEVVEVASGRVLRNVGEGTAWGIEARPTADAGALTRDSLAPGAEWPLVLTLQSSPQAHVRFRALGKEHGLVLGQAGVTPLSTRRRRNRADPRELWKIRTRLDKDHTFPTAGVAMLPVFQQIDAAVRAKVPVLLLGETGVGKSTVAELLHARWAPSGPLVRVSGAAGGGDPTIQRGEWLGYGKKPGIKDVTPGQKGHLLQAAEGTLFVDDADALSAELQALLLDPVEGRSAVLVGGDKATVNCRFIFATNRPLDELRGDLVGRLTHHITIPPLRERPHDPLLLAGRYAESRSVELSPQAWLAIARHRDWPTNIRGLQAIIDVAAGLAASLGRKTIHLDDLPDQLPDDLLEEIEGLGDEVARVELWRLADAAAGEEGFSLGDGRQGRAGAIMGVKKTVASDYYKRFRLAESA